MRRKKPTPRPAKDVLPHIGIDIPMPDIPGMKQPDEPWPRPGPRPEHVDRAKRILEGTESLDLEFNNISPLFDLLRGLVQEYEILQKSPKAEPAKEHEHEFLHIETIYKKNWPGTGMYQYIRIDRFYCRTCLETREVVKSECSRSEPDWWKE